MAGPTRVTKGKALFGATRLDAGGGYGFAGGNRALADMDMKFVETIIPSADITATGAGKLGHAQGQAIVSAPGAGKVIELVSAVLVYDYSTAAYGGGGNVTVNWGGGGAALTGVVSAANSFAAAGDKLVVLYPLTTVGVALVANTALHLVAASAFTQPGTAAGVIRVRTSYRVHTTLL